MNIEKAKKIQGWMIDSELNWLAKQASSRKMIAEIGSWKGRSTRALADNTKGTVYAVDTWLGSEEHQAELTKFPENWLFNEFKSNIYDLKNIMICRGTSIDSAQVAAKNNLQFDLVFLDANHDYDNVRADILAWRPLLVSGGLLCGHDYDDTWIGVVKAVNELIPNHAKGPNAIWYAL